MQYQASLLVNNTTFIQIHVLQEVTLERCSGTLTCPMDVFQDVEMLARVRMHFSAPPRMPQWLGQAKTIAATPDAHRSLQRKTGPVTIYIYTNLSQELLLERCDAHRIGEPSTEDMPQVLAGVLRRGMTSRSAETRPRCASSSISFSATFNGPIVARLMCSMGKDIGGSGPASCSSGSVNTLPYRRITRGNGHMHIP